MAIIERAREYLDSGLSVIPLTSPKTPNGGKRPLLHGWQDAPIGQLPTGSQNVGIRQGQQPNGRWRITFDFDYDAVATFPAFAAKLDAVGVGNLAVVQSGSGQGYHVIFHTTQPVDTDKILAAAAVDGKTRPIIECAHTSSHQVVAPPSIHPTTGNRYQTLFGSFTNPPILTHQQLQDVLSIARSFDQRQAKTPPSDQKTTYTGQTYTDNGRPLSEQIQAIMGGKTRVEPDGQVRILGNGGLLVNDAENIWHSFALNQGGYGLGSFVKKMGLGTVTHPTSVAPAAIVERTAKYLADIDFTLPKLSILDAPTGMGKTTYARTRPGAVILVMSSVIALEQLREKDPRLSLWYEKTKHWGQVTATTYEGFSALVKRQKQSGVDTSTVQIFIDEAHNLAVAGYRNKGLRPMVETLKANQWRGVCLMTGTPVPLPHSYFRNFETVKIQARQRKQAAQLVYWQETDENGKERGSQRNTIMSLIKRHYGQNGVVLVSLQNKTKTLHRYLAACQAAGLVGVYTLNSDNKYEAVGQQIAVYETLPEDCKILFVTDVFVESVNLTTPLAAVIVVGFAHHALNQQLVSRQRGDVAPGIFYQIYNGDGGGYQLDVTREYDMLTKKAERIAASLNEIDEHFRSMELDNDTRKTFGGEGAHLVKYDDKIGAFVVDELGVLQIAHDRLKDYERDNPAAYKLSLEQYGFEFLPDDRLIIAKSDTAGIEKKLADELDAVAKMEWLERLGWAKNMGAAGAESLIWGGLVDDPRLNRVLAWSLELEQITGDWGQACNLLAAVNETTQGFTKAKQTVIAAKLRAAGNEFVNALVDAFEIGASYTSDERLAIVRGVYEQFPHMRPFVEPSKRYSFSQEETCRLDERECNRILKLLFSVTTKRIANGDGRERVWVIDGDAPLAAMDAAGDFELSTSTKVETCIPNNNFGGRKTAGTRENAPPLGWGVRNIDAVNVAELADTIPF